MAFFAQHVTTGIDVSDRKLRLVRLQRKYRSITLHAFAELDLPAGVVEGGVVTNPGIFIQALKELPKRAVGSHWSTRSVHVGLPEQISFMTTVPIEDGDKEAAEILAQQSIPLAEAEMYYDTALVRTAKTISLAAARRDRIDHFLAQFDAANYEVVGLHVESEAIAQALLPHPLSKAPASLIIDIGSARTSVCFVALGSIHFTVSYPTVLNEGAVLDQALAGVARQAILYAQEHFGQYGAITQLLLAGSGAAIPQIDQWLQQVVQLPVVIGDPLKHIKVNHQSKKLSAPAPFATAIGLALAE